MGVDAPPSCQLRGYLGACAAFEFLLVQLLRAEEPLDPKDSAGLLEVAWHALGLALFLSMSLTMANVSGHSGQGESGSIPDIFVLLFVFLAVGLLLRVRVT